MAFRFFRKLLAASVAFATPALAPAQAQDASFGCKVLLCAAATSPNWSEIPYCVPVMTQLFKSLRKGGAWPSCPEGNGGSVGFQPYLACPAPAQAFTYQATGNSGSLPSLEADAQNGTLCADPAQVAAEKRRCGNDGTAQKQTCAGNYPTSERPRNGTPYFIDIAPRDGQPFRFYFNINGN